MFKILTALFLVTLFLNSPAVFAETEKNPSNSPFKNPYTKENIESKRQEIQNNIKERLNMNTEKREEMQENAKNRREALSEQRCQTAQNLIQNRINRIALFINNRNASYLNVVSKITEFKNTLESNGYDVSELEPALVELENLIQVHAAEKAELIYILENSQSDVCEDPSSFGEFMKMSNEQLKVIKQSGEDIRNYISNTIRPILEQIRNQNVENDDSSDNE